MKIALIFAMMILGSVIGHPMHQVVHQMKGEVEQALPGNPTDEQLESPHGAGHKCIHDRMVQEHKAKGIEVREVGDLPENKHLLGQAETMARSKIRLRFDTTKFTINSDTSRTCYAAGDTFISGDGGSSACSSSTEDSCTGTCSAADVMDSTKYNYVMNEVIPAVKDLLEDILLVNPPAGVTIPSGGNCGFYGGVDIPSFYTTDKFSNYDYVFFLTGRPTFGGTVAWAGSCLAVKGKPIAGHVNWGPSKMKGYTSSATQVDKLSDISTLAHEVMHALGFTNSMFDKFRDPAKPDDPDAFLPKSSVVKEVSTTYGSQSHTRFFIQTTAVKEVTKKFFGCEAITNGLQLEDGGGSGSAGSHWEKRILNDEFMTATTSKLAPYSTFSFALMQDSGHYSVNWDSSKFNVTTYGYQRGCGFFQDTCDNRPSPYFCSDPNVDAGCDPELKGASSCDLITHNSALEKWYQYFSNANKGGQDKFSDYCPAFTLDPPDRLCFDTTQSSSARTANGERYGSKSKCVPSTVQATSAGLQEGKCYETKCEGGKFKVLVDTATSNWVECPTAGGSVTISHSTLSGTIQCPNIKEACGTVIKPTTKDAFKDSSANAVQLSLALVFVVSTVVGVLLM